MLYKAYGLCIESEFNLSLLNECINACIPSVRVIFDKGISLPKEYKDTDYFTKTNEDSVIYYRKGIGLFLIKKNLIKFKSDSKNLNADFTRVLLGLPFGYLLMLRSQLTFHASAVAKNKKGIIFMGKSGMGKSTIAYELILKGFNFITEDICSILNGEILSSFALMKLNKNYNGLNKNIFTKEKFDFPTDSLSRKGYMLRKEFIEKDSIPSKILYIFMEDTTDSVQIKRLTLNQSIKLMHQNTFKTHPIKNDLLLKENIEHLIRFASNNEIYAVISSRANLNNRNSSLYKHLSERI